MCRAFVWHTAATPQGRTYLPGVYEDFYRTRKTTSRKPLKLDRLLRGYDTSIRVALNAQQPTGTSGQNPTGTKGQNPTGDPRSPTGSHTSDRVQSNTTPTNFLRRFQYIRACGQNPKGTSGQSPTGTSGIHAIRICYNLLDTEGVTRKHTHASTRTHTHHTHIHRQSVREHTPHHCRTMIDPLAEQCNYTIVQKGLCTSRTINNHTQNRFYFTEDFR